MELVLFSIMGDCVCKIVCQFVDMGSVYFWICVFLGWWLLGLGFFFRRWVLGLVLGLLFGGYVWYWVCLFVGW